MMKFKGFGEFEGFVGLLRIVEIGLGLFSIVWTNWLRANLNFPFRLLPWLPLLWRGRR